MLKADGKADGVFVTLLEPGTLLWFNSTKDVQTTGSGMKLPPYSIESQSLPEPR